MILKIYRVLGYASFACSFALLLLASTGLGLVPSVDGAAKLARPLALALDLGLLSLFAVQHTIMARASFKRALARVLPPAAERSTFVLASSACVAAMALAWAPIEGDIWRVSGAAAHAVTALALAGYLFAGASTFAFDHFEFFGLRAASAKPRLMTPLVYRVVRHPMMLGMLVAFWSAPRMTLGHLVFSLGLTTYILVGMRYEERDLERTFGDEYARYRARVPSLVPWPRPKG